MSKRVHLEVDQDAWALLEGYKLEVEAKLGGKVPMGLLVSAIALQRLLPRRFELLRLRHEQKLQRKLKALGLPDDAKAIARATRTPRRSAEASAEVAPGGPVHADEPPGEHSS